MFDPRILSTNQTTDCGCFAPRFAMLGSSGGLIAFANDQNKAIVAALASGNTTEAVRVALMTPWNPHPTDAQVQAALADSKNRDNVLLIIQRAGATPDQLKTIPQPGMVSYTTPAVQAALKTLQSGAPAGGGTATPSIPAAPSPAPAPPPPPATTTTSMSSPPTTTTGLTPDQISQVVGAIQSTQPGGGAPYIPQIPTQGATPPAPGATDPTLPGVPLATGPLDFLTAPLTLPIINVTVPAGVAYAGAGLLAWLFFKLVKRG